MKCNSKHGLFINELVVKQGESYLLMPNDKIAIGNINMVMCVFDTYDRNNEIGLMESSKYEYLEKLYENHASTAFMCHVIRKKNAKNGFKGTSQL